MCNVVTALVEFIFSLGRTLVQILVEDEEGHYIAATQVIAVIERNSNKFSENKQEFMVIRWFTEQQLLEEDVYSVMFTEGKYHNDLLLGRYSLVLVSPQIGT